ncbi:hypothetical protein [Demequina oxidasica]|uniref:hypothetical protein n=1 Tax=Demequina oxidasica TaxID=676199 RepID=UPI00078271BA|nr:hypothetical protein [Demequina oxidasica]
MNKTLWAIPLAATLALTACSGGNDDPSPTPTVTATESNSAATPTPGNSPSSQSEASIDVDSGGDPSADAQDASGEASLGTAVATVSIRLPDEWQYEGTYGDGALPYAVLVDAGQPFDLSEPGSDAYNNSVWVQVETYRVGDESPYGAKVPEDADGLANLIADATGGDGEAFTGGDIPLVHVRYTNDEGAATDELLARHGDIWILARPTNVDVEDYLDDAREGDTSDGILHAVLESSQIK